MIIKRGDGFYVLSVSRDKILGGPYRTRTDATKVFNDKVANKSPATKPSHLRSMARLDDMPWRTFH